MSSTNVPPTAAEEGVEAMDSMNALPVATHPSVRVLKGRRATVSTGSKPSLTGLTNASPPTSSPARMRAVTIVQPAVSEKASTGGPTSQARPLGSPRGSTASPLGRVRARSRAGTITQRLQGEFDKDALAASAFRAARGETYEPEVEIERTDSQGRRFSGSSSRPGSHALSFGQDAQDYHDRQEVELLEVVDHSVSTAAHLTNIGRSIGLPAGIPFLTTQSPAVAIPQREDTVTTVASKLPVSDRPEGPLPDASDKASISSSAADLDAHIIASHKKTKKEKFRAIMKGVWAFMKTPLGIFVTIYGICVVFFGAALVLILMGAIPSHYHSHDLYVEYCSQVLDGLFCITGLGLIPWRVVSLWHMAHIWTYANRVWRRRRRGGMAVLRDRNDLPDPECFAGLSEKEKLALEESTEAPEEVVLTDKELKSLRYHQNKFAAGQTWYKPHATPTHRAFPLSWALWICLCNIVNSLAQIALLTVMTTYNYRNRPAVSTALCIVVGFGVGITAGVLIWQGSERTKKKKEVAEAIEAHEQDLSSDSKAGLSAKASDTSV
ncbi:uncharacterized protein L969DRAFT_83119 [Mixia osmundae IAM 14324]|uniref:Uncharacterized protein n=1 Tax=Mixia osmundae (strain CBS 9802 / IAM 14324 / JCM 22182 / KY 12970) TaxID=764103 RepID=G7DWH0_MIXOS|nr:uncharacterized protein L969DRAFT_83119 [Mixia osmundae IAM 14324]KEI37332.1 hypothetical protein L969DRAFT_83119 [Mixia osmundae IAM 14324]GAA94930.1 hypothetical protein E5Q_01585 [Mixia osmundae IAM 14324]